jgi:hypothetical protein
MVECWTADPKVGGSSPPKFYYYNNAYTIRIYYEFIFPRSLMVEQSAVNRKIGGSSPPGPFFL